MKLQNNRPDDARYGLIYLIANGAGRGLPAFDGNVFRSEEEAEAFLGDIAGDNDEYMRLTSSLMLSFATREEAGDWEIDGTPQRESSKGETT